MLPDILQQGERARLVPVVAETSAEKRIASVFLAVLPAIPELANALLGSVGVRVGKRTKIETYTEVVLKSDVDMRFRPDGLIRVENGRNSWSALVEAKIGKGEVQEDQVSHYLELARENGVDAVITISNQLVARADHPPVRPNKALLRRTKLFHWPWMWVRTKCELLQLDDAIEDADQRFLLDEFLRFLKHEKTGVAGFTQMNKGWPELVRGVAAQTPLKRSSEAVEEAVGAWLEEQRDLCLQLSRHVGAAVQLKLERKLRDDPVGRLKAEIGKLVESNALTATLQVPDAASDIDICADIARKTVSVAMNVKAPQDRVSAKARINWLLRMVKSDDPRIIVRARWPGRGGATQASVAQARAAPEVLQPANAKLSPHGFEVILLEELGRRFTGPRTFIEDVERLTPEFYDLVGQHLRAWTPPPPKPVAMRKEGGGEAEPAEPAAEPAEMATPPQLDEQPPSV